MKNRKCEAMLKCPACGTDYPDGHYGSYCDICGSNIRQSNCPSCHNILEEHPTKVGVIYWCGTCRSSANPDKDMDGSRNRPRHLPAGRCWTCRRPVPMDRSCSHCTEPAVFYNCTDCKTKISKYNAKTSKPFFWCPACRENKENALLEDGETIHVPYIYHTSTGAIHKILGTKDGYLTIELPDGNYLSMVPKNALPFLKDLNLKPAQIPEMTARKKKKKCRVEKIPADDWEMYQRFKETLKDLNADADEALTNWRHHRTWLEDFEPEALDDIDDLEVPIRKMPRHLRYITTGFFPAMTDDDEDLAWYDPEIIHPKEHRGLIWVNDHWEDPPDNRKKGKLIVEVHIEDISTGDL